MLELFGFAWVTITFTCCVAAVSTRRSVLRWVKARTDRKRLDDTVEIVRRPLRRLATYAALVVLAVPAGVYAGGGALPGPRSFTTAYESSVKRYGAMCDGTTDDTVAIQAALTARTDVYIPAGTCIASNLTVINDNTRIYGNGPSSIIEMKTGSTGTLLNAGTHPVVLDSFVLYGQRATTQKTCPSAVSRTGVNINVQKNSRITRMTIHGFMQTGLNFAVATNDRLTHLVVSDSAFYNNRVSIYDLSTTGGVGTAEYVRMSNLDVHSSCFGIYLNSGNQLVTNSKITDNSYGVYVEGVASSNNGHGTVSNSMINHNTTAIYTNAVTLGFSFIGNQIFDGEIYLDTSTGIIITGGEVDLATWKFEAGGANRISNNYCPNAYGNTITHDIGSADSTVMVDNWKTATSWLDNGTTAVRTCGSALDGASPATCTATVAIRSKCGCGGTTSTLISCTAAVSGTTLTCNCTNGATQNANFWCQQ